MTPMYNIRGSEIREWGSSKQITYGCIACGTALQSIQGQEKAVCMFESRKRMV